MEHLIKLSETVKPDMPHDEHIQESLALLKILVASSQHLCQGKVKPLKQVFRDVRRAVQKFDLHP